MIKSVKKQFFKITIILKLNIVGTFLKMFQDFMQTHRRKSMFLLKNYFIYILEKFTE